MAKPVWITCPHMPTPQMALAFKLVDRAAILAAVLEAGAVRLIPHHDEGFGMIIL